MFKLVVLSALLALASAKPSYLQSLVAPAVYAAPTAVSHQSRVDIHSSPVLAYSAPVHAVEVAAPVHSVEVAAPVHAVEVAAPQVYAAQVAYAPTAVSHQSRVDVHSSPALVSSYISSPVVSSYSAPLVSAYHGHAVLAAEPTLALAPNTPAVVLGANGRPLDTIEVVNARAAHYTAKALNAHGIHKRSIAPVAYSAVYAPTAVSHQSRVDVHSSPVVAYSAPLIKAYSTPVLSTYSAPLLKSYPPLVSAYSSPLVSAYSSPLISSYSPLVSAHAAPISVHQW